MREPAEILASKALGLSPEHIAAWDLKTVRWPGSSLKWSHVQPDFILDGAHNPAGAAALAAYIREFFAVTSGLARVRRHRAIKLLTKWPSSCSP